MIRESLTTQNSKWNTKKHKSAFLSISTCTGQCSVGCKCTSVHQKVTWTFQRIVLLTMHAHCAIHSALCLIQWCKVQSIALVLKHSSVQIISHLCIVYCALVHIVLKIIKFTTALCALMHIVLKIL